MARMIENLIWNRNETFPEGRRIGPLEPSDFITSSSVKKKLPPNSPFNIYNTILDDSTLHSSNDKTKRHKSLWWWQPEQDSIPAQFLDSSSMHGLKYISQPKRHAIER